MCRRLHYSAARAAFCLSLNGCCKFNYRSISHVLRMRGRLARTDHAAQSDMQIVSLSLFACNRRIEKPKRETICHAIAYTPVRRATNPARGKDLSDLPDLQDLERSDPCQFHTCGGPTSNRQWGGGRKVEFRVDTTFCVMQISPCRKGPIGPVGPQGPDG